MSGRRLPPGAIAALLLALAAGFTLWFRANYEKRPMFVPVIDKPREERHNFTTAAAFLRASGLDVRVRRDLRFFGRLPEPDELLIVHKLPPEGPLRRNLFAWVEAGGRLVCDAGEVLRDDGRDTDLSRRLGIRRAGLGIPGSPPVQLLHAEPAGRPVRLDLGSFGQAVRVAPPFRPLWRLQGLVEWRTRFARSLPPLPSRFGAEPRDWALRMPLGRGAVTVLGDFSPLVGEALGRADNAFLLSELVRGHERVRLWLPGREASLVQRLFKGFPLFLGALALLAFALLWSRQMRLHPPIPLPVAARRDVLAYFEAAGRFAWRVNRADGLIRANREHLAGLLKQRPGRMDNLPESEKPRLLEDRRLALDSPVATPHDLVRQTRALVRRLRSLSKPGRR